MTDIQCFYHLYQKIAELADKELISTYCDLEDAHQIEKNLDALVALNNKTIEDLRHCNVKLADEIKELKIAHEILIVHNQDLDRNFLTLLDQKIRLVNVVKALAHNCPSRITNYRSQKKIWCKFLNEEFDIEKCLWHCDIKWELPDKP